MSRSTLNLRARIGPDDFTSLLVFASTVSRHVGFIVGRSPSLTAQRLLDRLIDYRVEVRSVSAWPGSERSGPPVAQHLYDVNSSTVALLRSCSRSFTDWQQPRLPNDLHFLRSDGTVVLGSVASEADAWLELDNAELAVLEAGWPGLRDRVVRGIRAITPDERQLISWLIDEWANSEPQLASRLRVQADHLQVVDGFPEPPSMLFLVEGSPPPINAPDGPQKVGADVLDAQGREAGQIKVWIRRGFLYGLDVSWWGDEVVPAGLSPSRLRSWGAAEGSGDS